MRLFVALRPSPEAADHLALALAPIRAGSGLTLRWTDPEQWHITLAFSPSVPEGSLEDVVADLEHLAPLHEGPSLHLSGAGAFSGRTLWMGVGGDTAPLGALMREELLDQGRPGPRAGAAREQERRRAHLTVARVSARAPRPPRRRRGEEQLPDPAQLMLAEAVGALSVYRGPAWRARSLELVSSRPGAGRSGGPLHDVLAEIPLGA